MVGVILNTEQEALDLLSEINTAFSFLFANGTTEYTYKIYNSELNKYAVVLDHNDVLRIEQNYPEALNGISVDITEVTYLSADWFKDEEL